MFNTITLTSSPTRPVPQAISINLSLSGESLENNSQTILAKTAGPL